MLRTTLSLGRWFGVELRIHLSFPVLLLFAAGWGAAAAQSPLRGVGVFCALILAVLVRELARILAALYFGLIPRTIFVLPVGSIMAMRSSEADSAAQRALLFSAPLANALAGLVLLGMSYAAAPGVHVAAGPWIAPSHVLRSFVWMQFVIAMLGLLPTAGVATQTSAASAAGNAAIPRGPGLMAGLAIAIVAAGMLTLNVWLVGLGAVALMLGFVRSATAGLGGSAAATLGSEPGDAVKVRDVMLTDSLMLSASDTLGGALERGVHSLQDVFPVLRGDRLVGSVSRQTLLNQMRAEGDGYLQGVMTRSLQSAGPDEPVVLALRRAAAGGASEFIPVVENGRMLGILTPQSLGRAVQQVQTTRRTSAREDRGE